jgi:GNAT superfamily N-acetyltransferase
MRGRLRTLLRWPVKVVLPAAALASRENLLAHGPAASKTACMEISTIDVNNNETVAQLLDLVRAAHAADDPDRPPVCSVAFPVELRQPPPGSDIRHRVVREDGQIVARLNVWMPTRDNLHLAGCDVAVRPEYRRRGIGRALMEAGFDIAREAGRRTATSSCLGSWGDGPRRPEAGARFLESLGFKLALTEVERRADVTALEAETEQRLYADARAKANGYEIISWTGLVPEEHLAGVAKLNSTFLEQAPIGDLELEAENIDADHLRARGEARLAQGLFMCSTVARHRASGEIVANTVIGVPAEPGTTADQWITLVAPEHRGHRLGLLIKLENLRQMRRERPQVRWLYTGNADGNQHMISINEQLGFEPLDTWLEYQRTI